MKYRVVSETVKLFHKFERSHTERYANSGLSIVFRVHIWLMYLFNTKIVHNVFEECSFLKKLMTTMQSSDGTTDTT